MVRRELVVYDDLKELKASVSRPRITHVMRGAKAEFCISYEFLNFPFSVFRETMSFRHPAPPFARVFAVESGRIRLKTGELTHILLPGGIYLLAPEMPFDATYYAGTSLKGFHILLRDGFGFHVGSDLGGVAKLRDSRLFNAIMAAAESGDLNLCMASVIQPLLLFLRPVIPRLEGRAEMSPTERRLFEALAAEPPGRLRIETLSKRLGVTRSALSKSFVRKFKIPLKRHIDSMLIDRARELLSGSDLTAAEIAFELGCKEPSYFQRVFKTHLGMTPLEYRRLCHGSQQA